jgi:hypothetical protein
MKPVQSYVNLRLILESVPAYLKQRKAKFAAKESSLNLGQRFWSLNKQLFCRKFRLDRHDENCDLWRGRVSRRALRFLGGSNRENG